MIDVVCPGCGKKYRCPEEAVGRKVRCKAEGCGGVMVVAVKVKRDAGGGGEDDFLAALDSAVDVSKTARVVKLAKPEEPKIETPDKKILFDPDAPAEIEEGRYVEIQVSKSKTMTCSKLGKVRSMLMSGKLKRQNLIRWVEAKPKWEDFEATDDDQGFRDALVKWEARRQWHPLGESMAKDDPEIRMLYDPVGVYGDKGFYVTLMATGVIPSFLVVGLAVIAMFIGLMRTGDAVAKSGVVMTRGMVRGSIYALMHAGPLAYGIILVILAVGTLVGSILGALFGRPIGLFVGHCLRNRFPKPPPDGYEERGGKRSMFLNRDEEE